MLLYSPSSSIQVLLPLPDNPTQVRQVPQKPLGPFHVELVGKRNFWPVRNSNILKSVFLPNINEKPKFHGLCGTDLLERNRGKEWRRLETLFWKIPADTFLINFATYWLQWGPNQTPEKTHKVCSSLGIWERCTKAKQTTNDQSRLIVRSTLIKYIIFKLVIRFKQFTYIQYLQTAIQLLKRSSKAFKYGFQFQNMHPHWKYLLRHVQLDIHLIAFLD